MATKITRNVDPQGRVSIPDYIRKLVGINPGDTVTIEAGILSMTRIRRITTLSPTLVTARFSAFPQR